jgi:hypothetical protein
MYKYGVGNLPFLKFQGRRKGQLQPAKPRVLIYSRDIGERTEQEKDTDWNLIAAAKVGGELFFVL